MAYYIHLFSPETYEAFKNSDRTISGFRERHKNIAADIKPGDKFICYLTKLSRWIGVLEVQSTYFEDTKPIFYPADDPFTIRFQVQEEVWLSLEYSIPIDEEIVWNHLSFTQHLPKNSTSWIGMIRKSLRKLSDLDGQYLEQILIKQSTTPINFALNQTELKKLKTSIVKTQGNKQVSVVIPTDDRNEEELFSEPSQRESIKIQAMIAEIGEKMKFNIWLPRSDRQRVTELWKPKAECLLEMLPLNYNDTTLKTIEHIDVIWIQNRSIIRAFEVEHTTSIYSGILRMADLMALQPNLNINAHIVAPNERREKVLSEIARPVFAFISSRPLLESCSFLSYDSIKSLAQERQLKHMSDSVIEEYAEYAEEADM